MHKSVKQKQETASNAKRPLKNNREEAHRATRDRERHRPAGEFCNKNIEEKKIGRRKKIGEQCLFEVVCRE
jgi:hypothetical protein